MKSKLVKYAPPGYDYQFDKTFYFVGLGIATAFSFSYLLRFGEAKGSLYTYYLGEKKLIPGAVMPDFINIFSELSDNLCGLLLFSEYSVRNCLNLKITLFRLGKFVYNIY